LKSSLFSLVEQALLTLCVLALCNRAVAADRLSSDSRPQFHPLTNAIPDQGSLTFHSIPGARWQFRGVLGQRLAANLTNWLLRAPSANPGMIEMFRVRDRTPAPNLVPWAGEFVGKYLISAIQALRMTDDPALSKQVSEIIRQLIASQAKDGYLGPFPKEIRLKANWDLWGHYHVMEALLMWHDATGDEAALNACRRAGDLICRTFLDQPLRVFDAGSHEMNMAVIHGLGQLYRRTGEARYLRMMREVEKDWERAGDYLRAGLDGREFFQSPRPRWESLHDLQGLLELYRITGEEKYRAAFEHHWRSITRWDRHNTGGFSSGEQATGNPYAPGAIETCCTVAWMALTVDMLLLTGDPLAADELELATFNGAAGAQHPSGCWWTYNTPMDGVREASAHTIVFQARAGTPELNCCSVNAPRSLGMLSEWALMQSTDGLVLNYYGSGQFLGKLPDGTPVKLICDTEFPLSGKVKLSVEPTSPRRFNLKLRIPAWSAKTSVRLNRDFIEPVHAGRYLELNRRWRKGDIVEIGFDMSLRFVTGDREAAGKVSLYRGPLLLAYDQRFNDFDEAGIPTLDLKRLAEAKVNLPRAKRSSASQLLEPWLTVDLPGKDVQAVRLCDFASAGSLGTRYRSWLAAENPPPPPVVTRTPADGASITTSKSWFKWTTKTNSLLSDYRLLIAETPDFARPLIEISGIKQNRFVLDADQKQRLAPGRWQYWKIISRNAHGESESVRPLARFKLDPTLAPAADDLSNGSTEGPGGVLVKAALRGSPQPEFGQLKRESGFKPAAGPDGQPGHAAELNGQNQMLIYALEEFPDENYSMAVWVRFTQLPENHLGQIFSAWAASMDDPLRVCLDKGKLFARIEAQQGFSTKGVAVEAGRWYHLATVKADGQLILYVDGKVRETATAPQFISSMAKGFALGGNPNFSGNEFLAAQFAGFAFFGRALSAQEVASLAAERGVLVAPAARTE